MCIYIQILLIFSDRYYSTRSPVIFTPVRGIVFGYSDAFGFGGMHKRSVNRC